MTKKILKFSRRYYNKVVTSIAFYPAIIALVFLLISYAVLHLDFSEYGKELKSQWDFLTLKDASTARSIAATVAAGILSLTVFSFSMVMILLNQAASNMSNRILGSMIGNRFQQWVLGFYIGTIVYALFLLTTIRDIDSGIYVPALSVYLLIIFTVIDIFLFIYFLHYITQSVKFGTIINRIHLETLSSMAKQCERQKESASRINAVWPVQEIAAEESGYYQGFNHKSLLNMCVQQDLQLIFLYPVGAYLLKGEAFVRVHAAQNLLPEQIKELHLHVDFYRGEPIGNCSYYGFKELAEVALKALSPGVNDPGTAVLSLHALADLLACWLKDPLTGVVIDENGMTRIVTSERSFKEILEQTLLPIWDYGQDDRILRNELRHVLQQLLKQPVSDQNKRLLELLQQKVELKLNEVD